jgi:cytochrome c-type biogenesis protein CcmF
MMLGNNLLLIVAAGTVLLGTLYPLFLDALNLGKISVGTPYFEAVFVPLIAPLAIVIGFGPLARWKEARLPDLARRLRWAFAGSVVTALALPVVFGGWSPWVAFGLSISIWIVASSAVNLFERIRGLDAGLGARLSGQPRGYYGMLAAHCGLAVFVAGVTLVKGYEVERDLTMRVGDTAALGEYRFRFIGASTLVGPNYTGSRGAVEILRGAEVIDTLYPEKRLFNVQRTVTTEAAIRSRPLGDLYVSLGERLPDGAWSMRLYAKPFVGWIWGGCLLMAFGGLVALSDRRYRQARSHAALVATQAA